MNTINYKDKTFVGIKVKTDLTSKVKEIFPKHGLAECHFCDIYNSKGKLICNDEEVADQIKEKFKGCNGFDMKNNIIFIEVMK